MNVSYHANQACAEECGQEYIVVFYDIAIAKMSLQIQLTEKPKFDKLFANLGEFHIEMTVFKALGKNIYSSGITEILVQSEVLAEGSMNGFLDGKHFNRCKRLHPLVAAALQSLHFEQFFSTYEIDHEIFIEDLKEVLNNQPQAVNLLV